MHEFRVLSKVTFWPIFEEPLFYDLKKAFGYMGIIPKILC